MTSRQQLRSLERTLVKRGRASLSGGLPQTPEKDDVLGVALVLAQMLADRAVPQRASAAALAALGLIATSARKMPGGAPLACTKGCGYCCHNWVGATAPEVLAIARAVRQDERQRPGYAAQIMARCATTSGLTPAQRFGLKAPCPLLENGVCGRYRERPAVCRQVTSFDVSGCVEEFEGRGRGEEIKVSAVHLAHARNARVPLVAAVRLAGLDARAYELSQALQVALSRDDVEDRWLAGEDVFDHVARAPAEPAAAENTIATIVAELGALMRRS